MANDIQERSGWRVGWSLGWCLRASCRRAPAAQDANGRLKVYLDCNDCFGDYIREEVDMVEYVRDPAEADVHIIVSRSDTGSGGVEQRGRADRPRPFQGHGLQVARDLAERRYRRHAAAAAGDSHHHRPAELPVERRRQRRVDRRRRADGAAGPGGPCDRSVELLGDERAGIDRDGRRRKQPRARPRAPDLGADRITDDWKITMGFEIEHRREDFDLDEDEPLRADAQRARLRRASSRAA